MSDYVNFPFDTFVIPNEELFDPSYLDHLDPIGQDGFTAYDYNATCAFDPGMDFAVDPNPGFDFNAAFQPDPPLPALPGATTTADQSRASYPEDSPSTLQTQQHHSVEFNHGSTKTNAHECTVCHQSFTYRWQLEVHSRAEGHAHWECGRSDCSSRFCRPSSLQHHKDTPHLPNHHEVWDDSAVTCAECNEAFRWDRELAGHARVTRHGSYACSCGGKFARREVLIRHLKSFTQESAKYQCTFCKRHRGKQAFRRRDHLIQHLQGYHKMEPEEINNVCPPRPQLRSRQLPICPHVGCDAYRDDAFGALPWRQQDEARPFQKLSDYNKHMRDVHEESAFECSIAGCDRVGAKGYMRQKDLMKHIAAKHPEAPSYSYVHPEPLQYMCERCGIAYTTHSILMEHQKRRCRNATFNSNVYDPIDLYGRLHASFRQLSQRYSRR